MSRMGFIQTRLERTRPGERHEMISFIPARIARPGMVVDLKDAETGEYTRGWTVMPNSGVITSFDVANELSQQHKSQRVGSDIERGSRENMKRKRR